MTAPDPDPDAPPRLLAATAGEAIPATPVADALADGAFRTRLMRHVRVKCHRLDPEDVFQRVCERALGRQAAFDATRPVYPWVAGIVVNVVREECRRAARQPRPRDDLGEIAPAAAPAETPAERAAEAARVIGLCLQRLSAADRELIEWQSFERLSHEQMATRKGVSNAAMRQRVNRAMGRLKAVAKDHLEGGRP